MPERFGTVFSLDGVTPTIADDAFIAPTAAVIGDVVIGSESGTSTAAESDCEKASTLQLWPRHSTGIPSSMSSTAA